jgi:hypothetical protein
LEESGCPGSESPSASSQFVRAGAASSLGGEQGLLWSFLPRSKLREGYLGFIPRDEAEDHGRLRSHLSKGKRKGYADRLEQLRLLRNNADYLDDLPWSDAAATAQSALSSADFLFKAFEPPKT